MRNENISEVLRTIFNRYENSSELVENKRFREGNSENMIFSRLERAAFNQRDDNSRATLSRYGIWGADVCQLVTQALVAINSDDKDSAKKYLKLPESVKHSVFLFSNTKHGFQFGVIMENWLPGFRSIHKA